MRTRMWTGWLGALVVGIVGCGGPIEPLPGDGSGGVNVPKSDENPTDVAKSLWPLSTGSTWTYRITDPVRGTFDKSVEVLGPQAIPGTASEGVAVRSVQPHLEELSWQVVSDGIVFRVREEDRKGGTLVRVMTWTPTVMKSLSSPKEAGWSRAATVVETEHNGYGALVDEKPKDFNWVVEAVDVSVTTAAGTWDNAVKLRRVRPDKLDWERIYWLVPGVGKVLEEGTDRREELIQFDVRP